MMTMGDARKRINAIKEYTALGSGFKIAMKDLEIRGAGNLLGTKQSGHISQIGFELYCQLLRQSVDRLKGRKDAPRGETGFKADCIIFSETAYAREDPKLVLPAFLPIAWLAETKVRITAYRELSEAATLKSLAALEASWRDRFGRIPAPAARLIEIAKIKALAAAEGISSVEIQGQRLMLHRNGDYILLEGRRFPRLQSASPQGKLSEAATMLQNF
jgi:transcription-repair coupling factor (superfamily II helicase)